MGKEMKKGQIVVIKAQIEQVRFSPSRLLWMLHDQKKDEEGHLVVTPRTELWGKYLPFPILAGEVLGDPTTLNEPCFKLPTGRTNTRAENMLRRDTQDNLKAFLRLERKPLRGVYLGKTTRWSGGTSTEWEEEYQHRYFWAADKYRLCMVAPIEKLVPCYSVETQKTTMAITSMGNNYAKPIMVLFEDLEEVVGL